MVRITLKGIKVKKYLKFEMHKGGFLTIKPQSIDSMSPAPEGGTRIVTSKSQVYYIQEEQWVVEERIEEFYEDKKNFYESKRRGEL